MNIKTMLARLESSLGDQTPSPLLILNDHPSNCSPSTNQTSDSFNIVLGYSKSPQSQAALELTLLIAYQTRLATRKRVVVQAVYVVEGIYPIHPSWTSRPLTKTVKPIPPLEERSRTGSVMRLQERYQTVNCVDARAAQIQCFDEADQVLWQARSFAMEWRGSLNTHLRFGSPAIELSKVAQQEQASLLVVGCDAADHPLIQQLQHHCQCPILGIPPMPQSA